MLLLLRPRSSAGSPPDSTGDRTGTFYAGRAIHGYGTQLLVASLGSPDRFEAIAQVLSITPGGMSTTVVERTHLRSPGAHRQKRAGLRTSGAFTLVGTWFPRERSQSNAGGGIGAFVDGGLLWLWRTRARRDFKIVLADVDQTEWPFSGVITKFQPGKIATDDKITFTCEITPVQDFSADLP